MQFDDLTQEDSNNILLVQSIVRQKYVQNEMLNVRNLYENIFNEIEGNASDTKIVWPSDKYLCSPKFVTAKKSPLKNDVNSLKSRETIIVQEKMSAKNLITLEQPKEKKEESTPSDTFTNTIKSQEFIESPNDLGIDSTQFDYLSIENLKNLSCGELEEAKENVQLDLLWIQQAIQSRIQYLKLKKSMERKKHGH